MKEKRAFRHENDRNDWLAEGMGFASSNEDRWERAEGVLLGGFAPSAQLRGDNLSSQVGCPSFDSSLSFRLTQNPRKRFFFCLPHLFPLSRLSVHFCIPDLDQAVFALGVFCVLLVQPKLPDLFQHWLLFAVVSRSLWRSTFFSSWLKIHASAFFFCLPHLFPLSRLSVHSCILDLVRAVFALGVFCVLLVQPKLPDLFQHWLLFAVVSRSLMLIDLFRPLVWPSVGTTQVCSSGPESPQWIASSRHSPGAVTWDKSR